MVDGPYIWDVGDAINFELFVGDPDTGVGLSGQTSFMTLTIQRDSDSRFWSGTAWVVSRTTVSFTEVDATNEPGRYKYTLSGITGNVIATRYVGHANINNPPTIEGDSYEVHVSRITDVKIYEAEPV